MGAFVIWLANSEQMTGGPGFQVAIGNGLEQILTRIERFAAPVPEPVLGLAVLALAAGFVLATLRDRHPAPSSEPEVAMDRTTTSTPAAATAPQHQQRNPPRPLPPHRRPQPCLDPAP